MTRAVIYDRVSVKDESSQTEHLRQCRDYAKMRGWDVVAEHVDTASGYKRDVVRPGWEEVRARVQQRSTDAVIIFAVSRAGRNAAALLKFVEDCRDAGVRLVSVTEPIDTDGPWADVIIALLGVIAQMESQNKQDRALVGRATAAREGTWTGGRRPYGWRPVKTNGDVRLVLDDAEAGHVRLAADVILNGGSFSSASRAMNAAGARTITGKPWTSASIPPLLSRSANAPEIMTASTLGRVRRLVKKRETVKGRRPRYLLTGLAYCGICGAKLKGKPLGETRRYVCTATGKLHLSILADVAERDVLSKCDVLLPPATESAEDPGAAPEDLAAQLREVESKLEELGEQVESGELSDAAFRGRERKLAARAAELEEEIERALPRGADRFAKLLKEMEENGPGEATPEETREWVELLVSRVVIKPGRSNRVELFVREGVRAQPRT